MKTSPEPDCHSIAQIRLHGQGFSDVRLNTDLRIKERHSLLDGFTGTMRLNSAQQFRFTTLLHNDCVFYLNCCTKSSVVSNSSLSAQSILLRPPTGLHPEPASAHDLWAVHLKCDDSCAPAWRQADDFRPILAPYEMRLPFLLLRIE
jgi:hypothetical protein